MTTELILLSRVSYRGLEVTGPRLRGLLALLAADLKTGCSTTRLVEGLWPDERPENPTKALQILVSRARSQLGADLITSTPTGYRLALSEDQVDSAAVLAHASAGARLARDGNPAAVLAEAEAGLALFVGAADGDGGDPVSALRKERQAAFRSLRRARALALSRLDRRAEALESLAELVDENKGGDYRRDEELLLELLRCEAAIVGPPAALERYETYRRGLRDELGTDPGPALRAVHRELLQGAAPVVRHGVPHEPNPLLGRDRDMAAVANLLRVSRVTSIVGPGGLGKTRLAHAVSRVAEQRVVHFVGLAAVSTDADVIGEVASEIGVGEARRGPIVHPASPADVLTGIVAALGAGQTLLVLDNCEHVVRGAADLVRALVSSTQDIRVLTTSRAPLGLSSESVYLLPELALPVAVELFGQRARAARPGVELPADAVGELAGHLDGLPLAVELAAARVRTMSVAEIAHRLRDRFALLRGHARDTPERHRTLQAVVDWSWNLLDPAGQAAMRALSVFPNGFTAAAAAALLGADDANPVLENLVDQSLVKVTDTAAGVRFRMLETVREFSTARRDAAGETELVTESFLGWARAVGVAHHDGLFGADPYSTVDILRAEQENLVQAHRQAVLRTDAATVAATAAVLTSLWTLESSYTRIAAIEEETAWILSHFRPETEFVEVTRTALAMFATYTFLIQGPRAARTHITLRRLPPAPPDTLARAAAVLLRTVDDLPSLFRMIDSDEPLVAAMAAGVASYFSENDGDLDAAATAARRMQEALDEQRFPWLSVAAHARIAELCMQLERSDEAIRHLQIALPVYERIGPTSDLDGLRWWLVLANLQLGDVDEAERWLELTAPERFVDDPGVYTYGLGVRAEIQLARGEVDAGLELWRRAVETLRHAVASRIRTDPLTADPWTLEARAVTVVAHARHGRAEQVEDVVSELRTALTALLTHPTDRPPPHLMEFRVSGAILLALAAVNLHSGQGAPAARLTALAERFRYVRTFQPTMSPERARRAAVDADRSAYDDAVSSYADLGPDALRAAALAVLRAP